MKQLRWSDENGHSAGWRNWGRLCLALIPAALGGAAILWITAAMGCLDLTKELRMERRTMQSVGISVMPRTPIHLEIHDGACVKSDSAYMDGDLLMFYAKNTCRRWLESPHAPDFYYRVKAHDGTVVESNSYLFDGDRDFGPQERREQKLHLKADDRIESVELWVRP